MAHTWQKKKQNLDLFWETIFLYGGICFAEVMA